MKRGYPHPLSYDEFECSVRSFQGDRLATMTRLLTDEITDELGRLFAAATALMDSLQSFLDPYDGTDCMLDHDGDCQSHYLDPADECRVKLAREIVAKAQGMGQDGRHGD